MVLVALRTVKEPFCERLLIVGLLVGLVIFNTILLVKQIRGAWDPRRRNPPPSPASAKALSD